MLLVPPVPFLARCLLSITVKFELPKDTTFTVLKSCPTEITPPRHQRPNFHAGAQRQTLICAGEVKSFWGTVQPFFFSPSPTPVWYFGESLFTEAGGDDNGLLLIPPRAGAPLATKIPKVHHHAPCELHTLCFIDESWLSGVNFSFFQ